MNNREKSVSDLASDDIICYIQKLALVEVGLKKIS